MSIAHPPSTGPSVVVGCTGIVAESVKRAFGEVRAVDGVTFSAPSGAVTALIGPNGSGKTALLMLAGCSARTPAPPASAASTSSPRTWLRARLSAGCPTASARGTP